MYFFMRWMDLCSLPLMILNHLYQILKHSVDQRNSWQQSCQASTSIAYRIHHIACKFYSIIWKDWMYLLFLFGIYFLNLLRIRPLLFLILRNDDQQYTFQYLLSFLHLLQMDAATEHFLHNQRSNMNQTVMLLLN